MTPLTRCQLDDTAQAFDEGRIDAALNMVRAVLRSQPDHLEARLLEARIHIARCRPEATLMSLDAIDLHHESQRGRPDVAMLRLDALMAAGEHTLALRLADKLARAFPDDPRPHTTAVEAALQLNRTDRAAEALRELVRICPSDRDRRLKLAELVESDRPDEAIALLRQERDAAQRSRVARLLVRVGRLRDAEESYRALMAQRPEDMALREEAGRLADAMGQDELAIKRLHDPASLAEAHMHVGRLATAGRAWWRAIRRGDAGVRAWAGLLACAIETGHEKTARYARQYMDLHITRQERQLALASIWPHVACGLAIHRAATQSDQQDLSPPSPLHALLRQATATLQRQVKRHPRRADAHYHLGVCRHAMGEGAAAEQAASEALRLNPRYAAASRLAMQLTVANRAA